MEMIEATGDDESRAPIGTNRPLIEGSHREAKSDRGDQRRAQSDDLLHVGKPKPPPSEIRPQAQSEIEQVVAVETRRGAGRHLGALPEAGKSGQRAGFVAR